MIRTLLMGLGATFSFLNSAHCIGSPIDLGIIKLPDGFKIEYYAQNLPGARSMSLGDNGTVYIGTRNEGSVYAVTLDRKVHKIASRLNQPNGVAFRDGALYVAEVNRLLRFDQVKNHLDGSAKYTVITDHYPKDKHHGWKFIAFGPDGYLYIPVGAPCNTCRPADPIYASITRIKPDGTERMIYASGVRNSVGFDWHPVSKELWFTDNGRDWMGDDVPGDELNHAPRPGMHFGYPYCHEGRIADPEFGDKENPCSQYNPPAQILGAHVAALGMRFYTGKLFPPQYQNQIFIAEHGSWNRSVPVGYRVSLVTLTVDGKVKQYRPFAEGWLQGKRVLGRPADVLVAQDGALLVSDDLNGVLYRIFRDTA